MEAAIQRMSSLSNKLKTFEKNLKRCSAQDRTKGSIKNQSKVKLPKVDLPKFSGSYHDWLEFKNRFTTLIHKNAELTNIEKLDYLKSCTTDEAERTIKRYQITDENYQLAWKRLNDKFDNKRILQAKQVETILDQKAVTTESASAIRDLIEELQNCLESLTSLGVDIKSWDVMLIVLLTRKLPFQTRSLWEQTLQPTEVPTYEQLVTFLEQRYRALECLQATYGSGPESKFNKNQYQGFYRNKTFNNANSTSKSKFNCVVCNSEPHSLTVCEKFLNMPWPNRNAFVNARQICKNCLAISHSAAECKSQKTCFKCGRKHHTLLHREDPSPSFSNSNSNPFSRPEQNRAFVTNAHVSQVAQSFQSPNHTHSARNSQNPHRRELARWNPNNQSSQISQTSQHNQLAQNNQLAQTGQQRSAYTTTIPYQPEISTNSMHQEIKKEMLFPTAIVKVKSSSGVVYTLRSLLDQCSDGAFIKASVAKMLGLKSWEIQPFDVTGLDEVVTSTVQSSTNFEMYTGTDEIVKVDAYVISTLVGILPKVQVKYPENMFKNIKLADPTFATPGNVDIMLGGVIYSNIILEGVLKEGGYLAQNTKLGWIISGRSNENIQSTRQSFCFHTRVIENQEDILKKIWQIEQPPQTQKRFTAEEKQCEEIFKRSYRRLSDGRVEVELPFKEDPSKVLGASRNLAVARWIAMEKKLERDPVLKKDYMNAIQEHFDLGHIERVDTKESDHAIIGKNGKVTFSSNYIPHHAVVKPESTATKTRIVFDASAKTSTKVSLNDILIIGPTIQESLLVRILKWRIYKYVLRGDITKMYRQIRVHVDHHNYQRIVFRFNKNDPIEDFRLVTLTFGTASAPYMAIKSIQQVADDETEKFPVGAKVVKNDFHVDDLLTGSDSIQEVKVIYEQTKDLLKSAGFPMRKWSSNNNQILEDIPEDEREIKSKLIEMDDIVKTLGIGWLPLADTFFFSMSGI